jgi:hypothetical protein
MDSIGNSVVALLSVMLHVYPYSGHTLGLILLEFLARQFIYSTQLPCLHRWRRSHTIRTVAAAQYRDLSHQTNQVNMWDAVMG